jgi:acylpyruvate hydrolase
LKFVAFESNGAPGLAISRGEELFAIDGNGDLLDLIRDGGLAALRAAHQRAETRGRTVEQTRMRFLPPIAHPPKIICVGLNYADHAAESPYELPKYPTIFPRYTSTLIGHGDALIRPRCSEQLDYEGELVAVIGKGGRHIPLQRALDHVIGYSIFNEASIRDYQFKAPQWTMGKNFDSTGAFGPAMVTADALPPGGSGLRLQTRLNGKVVQSANTKELVFDVANLVAILSEAMTLEAGDIISTGTPAGVGFGKKPPVYMKDGDVVEVEIEGIGVLRNPVRDEGEA